MRNFITGTIATLAAVIGFIFLFFRKGGADIKLSPKTSALDKKAEVLKSEIKELESNLGKPVEDTSLESELDYWNKEKK
jgi:hypothetical protein